MHAPLMTPAPVSLAIPAPMRRAAYPAAFPMPEPRWVGAGGDRVAPGLFAAGGVLQAKLAINQPGDPYEQEADRVAAAVVRDGSVAGASLSPVSPAVQRQCACGGEAGPEGECEKCRIKRLGLQRKAANGARGEAPPIVHEALRSPGQPLDRATRAFMEPRFGRDLGDVRIHTDGRAVESAHAVNALAYTAGRDVVFGAGQYQPDSTTGRFLMAHELAHVVQQRSAPTVLARYVPASAPPPVQAPVRPPSQAVEGVPLPGPVYVPEPGSMDDLSLGLERAEIESEGERPSATTARGGKVPDFLTDEGRGETATPNGNVSYRLRSFHLLDAMEHDINDATSSDDLIGIYAAYFPDSELRFGRRSDASWQRAKATTTIISRMIWQEGLRFDPKQVDPGGTDRALVFTEAVKRKRVQTPSISTDPLAEALIQELVMHEAASEAKTAQKMRDQSGPCQAYPEPHKGGNAAHNAFADRVTGNTSDYTIVAPGGVTCSTDGLDSSDPTLVWEVKTRHEWSTGYGSIGAIYSPQIQNRIYGIEEQRQRCLLVTDRCGFRYHYAFDTKEVADDMRKLWSNKPPVFHR